MMSGAGSHYSRQLQHLEALLKSKHKQLALLEKEHELLRHKESALQSAIHSIEGPLALVTASIGSTAASTPAAGQGGAGQAHASTGPAHLSTELGSWDTSATPTCSHEGTASPCNSGDPNGLAVEPSAGSGSAVSTATGLAAATYRSAGPALLQQLCRKEERVQRVLQQLGCCTSSGYQTLYTTQLLQNAVRDPARMAGYLNMPKPERLRYWSNAYSQMALLLGKYDANVKLASGYVRDQLDHVVDELFERVVVCALLDPPQKHMSCFMFNVDTHEFEQYPAGWWKQVAEGMSLTAENKAALKLVWDRVRSSTQMLSQEWERSQQQLQQLHALELQQNRQFERAIKQLPSLLQTLSIAEHSRHQQQQQVQVQQQQQQQQAQQQQQEQALQKLHAAWQQEDLLCQPGGGGAQQQQQQQQQDEDTLLLPHLLDESDPTVDLLFAELAAELEQEQRLEQQVQLLQQQQQQQAGAWGSFTDCTTGNPAGAAAPLAAAAAAGGDVYKEGEVGSFTALTPPQQQQQQMMMMMVAPAAAGQQCGVAASGDGASPATPTAAAAAAAAAVGGAVAGRYAFIPSNSCSPQAPNPNFVAPDAHSGSFALTAVGVGSGDGGAPAPAAAAAGAAAGGVAAMSGQQPAAAAASGGAAPAGGSGGGAGGGRTASASSGGGCMGGGNFTELEAAEEVLLQVGTEERRRLEQRLQAITNKMKVLNFSLVLQLTNSLTKKQLAAMCAHSHPFVFDVEMICQALEDMGWDS